ncbi:cob(I)yrinic acid a,c-diamide adenosyltransferase [Agrobacterium sp. NPDC089420]|uniref:cob(I)yrinic acid a,c-diamide adenosyltransferase n=1 Tax=Agrobacterium sp. NPDC089420 TaxID=3363918 RepID=UPI00384CAD64
MVKLNKIYTRTGDKGTTALVSGPRRLKHDLRVEAYGTVDETNSAIGMARLHTGGHENAGMEKLDAMLFRIQNDLFDLGADLATPDSGEPLSYEPLRIVESQVTRLENEIDELNATLEPLTSFVLPGGTAAAAGLHMARTVCRRAERLMVALSVTENEIVSPAAIKYANRLSDFLFVAARFANDTGRADILWVPGKNR